MLRLSIRLKSIVDVSTLHFSAYGGKHGFRFNPLLLARYKNSSTKLHSVKGSQPHCSESFFQTRRVSDLCTSDSVAQGGEKAMSKSPQQRHKEPSIQLSEQRVRQDFTTPSTNSKRVRLSAAKHVGLSEGEVRDFRRIVEREVKKDVKAFKKCEPECYVAGFKALLSASKLSQNETGQLSSGSKGHHTAAIDTGEVDQQGNYAVDLNSIKPLIDRVLENSERLTLDSHRDVFCLYTEMFHRSSFVHELIKRGANPSLLPESTLPDRWREWQQLQSSLGIRKDTGIESKNLDEPDVKHVSPILSVDDSSRRCLDSNLKFFPNEDFGKSLDSKEKLQQRKSSRPLVIVLSGATGVGKTFLSLELAHLLNGEVISADSVQVYKGLDVGSAKISKSEMQGIPHHLIDVLDPQNEEYSAGKFFRDAMKQINEVISRGKTPIVVGGTGMYLRWLLYGPPSEVPVASAAVSAASKYWVSLLKDSSSGEFYWKKMDKKEWDRRVDREFREVVSSMTPIQIQEAVRHFENKDCDMSEVSLSSTILLPWQIKLKEKQARKKWEKHIRGEIQRSIERTYIEPFMNVLYSEFIQHQYWKQEVVDWILSYLRMHDTHRLEKALAHALSTMGQHLPRPYREQLQANKALLNQLADLTNDSQIDNFKEPEQPPGREEWENLISIFKRGSSDFATPPQSWVEEFVPCLEKEYKSNLELGHGTDDTKDETKTKSKLDEGQVNIGALSLWDVRCLYLTAPRDLHSILTDLRCEQMIAQGLYSECAELSVRNLMGPRSVCSKSIGYRQIMEALSDPYIRDLWILLKEKMMSHDSKFLNSLSWNTWNTFQSLDFESGLKKLSQLLIVDCKFDKNEIDLVIRAGRSHQKFLDDLKASTRRFSRKQHAWFKSEPAYRFLTVPLDHLQGAEGGDSLYGIDQALSNYKANLSSLIPLIVNLMKVPQPNYWRELLLEGSEVQELGRLKARAFPDGVPGELPASKTPGALLNAAIRNGSQQNQRSAMFNELLTCLHLMCALVEVKYFPNFSSTPQGGERVASLMKISDPISSNGEASFSLQAFPKRSQLEVFVKSVSLRLRNQIQKSHRRIRMTRWINFIADQVLSDANASETLTVCAAQGYVKYILSTGELPGPYSSKHISHVFLDSRLSSIGDMLLDKELNTIFDLKCFQEHKGALLSYLQTRRYELQTLRFHNLCTAIQFGQKIDSLKRLGSLLRKKRHERTQLRKRLYHQALFDHLRFEEYVSCNIRQKTFEVGHEEKSLSPNDDEGEDQESEKIVEFSGTTDSVSNSIPFFLNAIWLEVGLDDAQSDEMAESRFSLDTAPADIQSCSPQPFAPSTVYMESLLNLKRENDKRDLEENVLHHFFYSSFELLKAMHRLHVWMPSILSDLETVAQKEVPSFDKKLKEFQILSDNYHIPAYLEGNKAVMEDNQSSLCKADVLDLSELENDEIIHHLTCAKARLRSLQAVGHKSVSQKHESCRAVARDNTLSKRNSNFEILYHPYIDSKFDGSTTLLLNENEYLEHHVETHRFKVLKESSDLEQIAYR